MSTTIAAVAALFLLVAIAFVLLFRRVWINGRGAGPEPDLSHFSLERYRPMERLFSSEDYEFLASQPGFTPRIARRLAAERRKIFRRYLRCLKRDFDRLYAATKLLLLHSAEDRPDLAMALLKQRLTFQLALAAVYCRLGLQTLGLGTVDARGLITALEAMRNQLRALSPQLVRVPVES